MSMRMCSWDTEVYWWLWNGEGGEGSVCVWGGVRGRKEGLGVDRYMCIGEGGREREKDCE